MLGGLLSTRARAPEALAAIAAGIATWLVVRFRVAAAGSWLDPTLLGLVAAAAVFAGMTLMRAPAARRA
ncbi:hypothetical protein D3C83_113650 [compost metagenome]